MLSQPTLLPVSPTLVDIGTTTHDEERPWLERSTAVTFTVGRTFILAACLHAADVGLAELEAMRHNLIFAVRVVHLAHGWHNPGLRRLRKPGVHQRVPGLPGGGCLAQLLARRLESAFPFAPHPSPRRPQATRPWPTSSPGHRRPRDRPRTGLGHGQRGA